MKKCIVVFVGLIGILQVLTAQNLFTKEMGPAMNMDNSLGAILMDLSTQNKDILMNGESAKSDTSKKYYPKRLFGANQVYISRTIEEESLYKNLQDPSTLGQIFAVFYINGMTVDQALTGLKTNIEKSTVYSMFFKLNTDNKDPNRVEYVQNKPFVLPNNGSLSASDLETYNKGLKQNFEEYEIRISVEKGGATYMGQTTFFPQIRSWVQLKPFENLTFELPDFLPTQQAKDTIGIYSDMKKYFGEASKFSEKYIKLKEDYELSKTGKKGVIFNPLRTAYILNEKAILISSNAMQYISKLPKELITPTLLKSYFSAFSLKTTFHNEERRTIVDTFTK